MTRMRVLIATMPAIGHVNPLRPIVRELHRRGHHVRWWTGRPFGAVVSQAGAHFLPMSDAAGGPIGQDLASHPERAALRGMARLRWDIERVFLDPIPAQVTELRRLLAGQSADVLVSDTGLMGAGPAHELDAVPWVSVGVTPLALPSRDTAPFGTGRRPPRWAFDRLVNRARYAVQDHVLRGPTASRDRVRAALGLDPSGTPLMDTGVSPLLHLQSGVPELEYPRSDLPGHVRFVGALAEPLPTMPAPAWWPDVAGSGRPIVHVTQGTVADNDLEDLVAPTIRALAGLDVWVVATSGRHDPAVLGPLPANARVARMLPYQLLLPCCSVMVTNGGYGGVQQALARGVPLVVAGASEDKPEVAARVAWSGAGIDLRTGRPPGRLIRAAVRAVLADPSRGACAQRLAAAYRRVDAGARSAELIEELVRTEQTTRTDRRELVEERQWT